MEEAKGPRLYDGPQAQEASGSYLDQAPREATDAEISNIARVCHEANRAYCLSIGDDSQPPWDNAPGWQRDSAMDGVRKALEKGRRIGLMRPDDSHNAWLEMKLRDGWTFGPVKDPEKKQHPCMLPYLSLPEEQRRKDVLFTAIVAALNPLAGA